MLIYLYCHIVIDNILTMHNIPSWLNHKKQYTTHIITVN